VVTKGLPEVLYEEEITLKISTQEITIPNPISYYIFKKIPYEFRDITDVRTVIFHLLVILICMNLTSLTPE